jgi:hypothetical protein
MEFVAEMKTDAYSQVRRGAERIAGEYTALKNAVNGSVR